MYTKEAICEGFTETRGNCFIFDRRNYDNYRCESTLPYAVEARNFTTSEFQENWLEPIDALADKGMNCDNIRDFSERSRLQDSWRNDRSSANYVHIPSAVAPIRSVNEHSQMAKKRRFEPSIDENDLRQVTEMKRRKVDCLNFVAGNCEEISLFNVDRREVERPTRRLNMNHDWTSRTHETEGYRGRSVRSNQHISPPRTFSESCSTLEEPSGKFVRTSSKISYFDSRFAKENIALHNQRMPTGQRKSGLSSHRKLVSVDQSSHSPDIFKPFVDTTITTTTTPLSLLFQPEHRDFDKVIKPTPEVSGRNCRNSNPFLPSSVYLPAIQNSSILMNTKQSDRVGLSRAEYFDLHISHLEQNETSRRSRLACEKDWNRERGAPVHNAPEVRADAPNISMEDSKENMMMNPRRYYRDRVGYEEHLSQERMIRVEGDTTRVWKTVEGPFWQEHLKPRLRKHECLDPSSVWTLNIGRPEYSQHQERSSASIYVAPPISRDAFVTADVINAAQMNQEEFLPRNGRIRIQHEDSDITSTRRWTSKDNDLGINSQNVRPRSTIMRAKSLSPQLRSNVTSGTFGSLESIRSYYKKMAKSGSSGNRCDETPSVGSCPEIGTDEPIDLSNPRVQKPGQHDKQHDFLSLCSRAAYHPGNVDNPEMWSAAAEAEEEDEEGAGDGYVHRVPFDKQALAYTTPNTGSSSSTEPSIHSPDEPTEGRWLSSAQTSISLPSSRLSSPTPISDNHLPPKKRRLLSYDWIGPDKSIADENREPGKVHQSPRSPCHNRFSPTDARVLEEDEWLSKDETTTVQRTHVTDLDFTIRLKDSQGEQLAQLRKIHDNSRHDAWALTPDEDGDLPLHIAVARASESLVLKCLKIMNEFGTSVDRFNRKRKTPLHLAVISKQPSIVDQLLRAYASPNVGDRNGDSSIHLAIKYRSIDCLKCLVTKSNHVIDLDARNYEGLTALHLAVLSDELEFVQILLRVKAGVNVADGKTGRTPLHCAAERNNEPVAKLLLAYGADPRTTTYSGSTPAQVALAKSHLEMTRMLEQSCGGVRNFTMSSPKLLHINKQANFLTRQPSPMKLED